MAPRKKTEEKPAEEAERVFTEAETGERDDRNTEADKEEEENPRAALAPDWDDEGADEADEDGQDGQDDENEPGDGTDPAKPLNVALVPPTASDEGFQAGEALTPGQRAGLDPLDEEKDAKEAAHRDDMTNRQTTHEFENGLDPTSRDPNAGVTPNVAYTAAATGAPPSDHSGRPPLSRDDETSLSTLRQGLTDAKSKDASDKVEDARQGWRTPAELGLSGGIVARLQGLYPNRIEVEQVPGGANFPETGKRYRLK